MSEEAFVRYIAENLCNDVDAIAVKQREAGRTSVVELKVASEDMGRVIGKNGRVANAMRTLLRSMNDNQDRRIILEIE